MVPIIKPQSTGRRRRTRRFITINIFVLFLFFLVKISSQTAFAHDESNGNGQPQQGQNLPGQMNTRIAVTGNFEVVIKYPTPLPGEEIPLQISISDLVTDAPVDGVKLSMAINRMEQSETSSVARKAVPITAAVSADKIPGTYQARAAFPDSGLYKISLLLAGPGVDAAISIPGIFVAERASRAVTPNSKQETIFLAIAIFLGIAAVVSLFLIRPRKLQPRT